MPLTAITMLTASITMFLSWFVISHRIDASKGTNNHQAALMSKYFLFMGIFCFFMFLPHTLLQNRSTDFPQAMAIGYVFGHIFCYIAFIYIYRLVFSMVPRLVNKDTLIVVFGGLAATIITVVNALTMIWGTRPQFDSAHGVTQFNAHPVVGIGIIVFVSLAVLPFVILLVINGINNSSARLRSFLIAGGFLLAMVAGPLHDNATTASVYAFADIITIISVLVTTSGILYRIEEKMTVAKQVAPAVQ